MYVKKLATFWVCSKLTTVFNDNEETREAYMSGQKFKLAFHVERKSNLPCISSARISPRKIPPKKDDCLHMGIYQHLLS